MLTSTRLDTLIYEPLIKSLEEYAPAELEVLIEQWRSCRCPQRLENISCTLQDVISLEARSTVWTYLRFLTPQGECILRTDGKQLYIGTLGTTEEPIYQALMPTFQCWQQSHPGATYQEKILAVKQFYEEMRQIKAVELSNQPGPICPLCRGRSTRLLIEQDISFCSNCQLTFRGQLPVEDILALYTEEHGGYFNQLMEASKPAHAHGYEFYQEWIRVIQGRTYLYGRAQLFEHLSQKTTSRLLEVGCATGEMLATFHERGWDVTGLEPSPFCVQQARKGHGLKMIQGTLETARFAASSFDLILYMDVFEHLPDPHKELQTLQHLLAPGGTLILELPNQGSLDATILGRDYLFEEHLFFYTPLALRKLLALNNFSVSQITTLHDAYNRVQRFLTAEEAQQTLEELQGERLIVAAIKG